MSFNLHAGRLIAGKYEVVAQLGAGWEGEVYKIRETSSGIERAAKLFFPERNPGNKSVRFYATKLHKLRNCNMVIQYHNEETITVKGQKVTVLISEFVDGIMLSNLVQRAPGKRLQPYVALHLLYALATGLEEIHQLDDYHGDLHSDNIIVQRQGLHFDLRLLDLFNWGRPRPSNMLEDTVDLIKIFYDILGGQKHYSKQPAWVKQICCGKKTALIKKKFRTAGQLRSYLESLSID
ncbi:protein kinase [bacterium]|nr:protein kinase [bacterium]